MLRIEVCQGARAEDEQVTLAIGEIKLVTGGHCALSLVASPCCQHGDESDLRQFFVSPRRARVYTYVM